MEDYSDQLIEIAEKGFNRIKELHQKENNTGVTLEQARLVLANTSETIFALFHLRQLDSGLIAAAKQSGEPILDMSRELEVIERAGVAALAVGLDPKLSKTLMWMITAMSKEVQRILLMRDSVFTAETLSAKQSLINLLELTRRIAPKYGKYGDEFNATKITHEVELAYILEVARGLSGVAVDLGTANGYIARALAQQGVFSSIHGYDISPEMIEEAQKGKGIKEEYKVLDISQGIPHEDSSIDFLVASLGSAGEVHTDIIHEVARVLKKGGKAWLSFYNKDAFVHLSWQPQMHTLEVVFNPLAGIVMVPVWNDETSRFDVFKISAISKDPREIRKEVKENGLTIRKMRSFPLFTAIVAPTFFDDAVKTQELIAMDRRFGNNAPHKGFYLNILLEKQ